MRNILNLLLTFGVLWLGNSFFNDSVQISDTKTMVIASLIMFGISMAYGILLLFSASLIPIGVGCFTTVILFVVGIGLTPIKLLLLNKYLEGFTISGFWTYVLITVCLSIFTINFKSNEKEA